ncbi:MAG TPA: DEAD/DEAH box helicase [Thermoanaerobaculia bacterium]|nr:DEAD/DEAH box helicase [Thermoanaerobaculia bacterium]
MPSRVRKRGLQYFRSRNVSVHSSSPDEVTATVTGSDRYRVRLARDAKEVVASCSCPYFADRRELCKHVWATVLAADGYGGLRAPGSTLPFRLVTKPADRPVEPPAPAPAPRAQKPAPPAPPPVPLPRNPPAPRAPTWREILNLLPEKAPAPDPARVIVYVIDVPATIETQDITVDLLTGRRKADGAWGKLHALRAQRSEIPGLPEPADREILALLAGAEQGNPYLRWSYSRPLIPPRCEIPASAAKVLIPLLCATGRCHVRLDPEDEDLGEPLVWGGGEPWQLWLEVREAPDGSCAVSPAFRRGEERMPLDEPVLLLQSSLLLTASQGFWFDDGGAFGWIPLLRRAGGALRVPGSEREELLEQLFASPSLPRLELPETLRVEEVRTPPRPHLRLLPPEGEASREWLHAELSFLYDGRDVPSSVPGRALYQRDGRRLLIREPEAERRAAGRLRELGFRPYYEGPRQTPLTRIAAGRVPAAIRKLLAEGWSVDAQGKLYRSSGAFQISVSSGVDWFEMRGQAEFEGESVELPELLAALRKGEGFVTLGDGSLGLIPEEWLKRLGPVAALGQADGDHLKFKAAQVALLDAWLDSEPAATCDEAFDRARQRLRSFEGIAPAEAPRAFKGELRGYQRAGLGWLHFLRDFGFGGCLADDMGLGKTVQVLALLESRRALRERLPSLVVVPKSLIFNWLAEAERFTPKLRVLNHTGIGRTRKGDPFAGWDVVLTTYGTLRRDLGALRQAEFDYVILDEAQAIKNADSQTAKAARLLRGRHRLALTGTPVENHLGELWSLLEFLNPGFLGASTLLRSHSEELRNPGPETRSLLSRALRPFLLRRTKEQVAPELPARLEQTLVCELPPDQRRLYDELRDHYRSALGGKIGEQGLGRSKILVLEALLRLRQAACHPGLLDPKRADEPCAKLDLLLPQLQEIFAEGHKALVFSQFTAFLGLLRRQLDREGIPYLYLDGRTRDRQEKVEQFQSDPAFPLFLISLKAGGLGLNLTAADYVYLLDPWWNPAVEAQAIDRAHRIGQTRPVFASRIVAKDTVEEKILELQKSKRELADAIIQADKSLLAALSREDLELLLS